MLAHQITPFTAPFPPLFVCFIDDGKYLHKKLKLSWMAHNNTEMRVAYNGKSNCLTEPNEPTDPEMMFWNFVDQISAWQNPCRKLECLRASLTSDDST